MFTETINLLIVVLGLVGLFLIVIQVFSICDTTEDILASIKTNNASIELINTRLDKLTTLVEISNSNLEISNCNDKILESHIKSIDCYLDKENIRLQSYSNDINDIRVYNESLLYLTCLDIMRLSGMVKMDKYEVQQELSNKFPHVPEIIKATMIEIVSDNQIKEPMSKFNKFKENYKEEQSE